MIDRVGCYLAAPASKRDILHMQYELEHDKEQRNNHQLIQRNLLLQIRTAHIVGSQWWLRF